MTRIAALSLAAALLFCERAAAIPKPGVGIYKRYGMAGCGLGSMVVRDERRGFQLFAATTNTTSGQSFAISSGSSRCTTQGLLRPSREREAFFGTNYEHIAADMARGGGPHLEALLDQLACPAALHPRAGALAQKGFSEIFPPDKSPSAVRALYVYAWLLSEAPTLREGCRAL